LRGEIELMIVTEVIWLEQFAEKIEHKHRVSREEVEQVFLNRPRFQFAERGDVPGEDLYRAIGRTDAGRYLIVFFIRKQGGRALLISARDTTRQERKHYG
jgi:uncharacterized DUF497 family protein